MIFSLHRNSKVEKMSVMKNRFGSKLVKEWASQTLASKLLNIPKSSINLCLKGNYVHAGGFVWKYS